MRRNCILFLSILLTCVLVNAAAADTLQITEAVYQNNGKVHLAWTDDAQRESYLVTSFCVEPNGGANVQIAQEKVTGTSCDVLALPGTTMAFAVSVEGAEASETTQVEIPVQPVRDFKVSGNVQLLRSLYEKTTRMNSFSVSVPTCSQASKSNPSRFTAIALPLSSSIRTALASARSR